jgi:urease accessory protein
MLIFTQHNPKHLDPRDCLALDAEARSRPHLGSREQPLHLESGEPCYLRLPRGTVLQQGDCIATEMGDSSAQIVAKSESVLTVTALHPEGLLKAAYHLGNRHVPLEITVTYLRLSPDPVLQKMLEQMDLEATAEVAPFFPELGAYHSHH